MDELDKGERKFSQRVRKFKQRVRKFTQRVRKIKQRVQKVDAEGTQSLFMTLSYRDVQRWRTEFLTQI